MRIYVAPRVLASRASRHHLDTQTLKNHPSGHPKIERNFRRKSISSIKLIFFYLNIIPMTLYTNIRQYFIKEIHVYGCNLSILRSPLKNKISQNFTNANFGHLVSKSWLIPSGGIGVLASRASGHHLGTQTLKHHSSGHPNLFVKNF